MKKLRTFKYLFGGIGLALLVGAIAWWFNTRNFIARAAKASGTVVELVEVRDSDGGSSTYKPVVNFTATNGTTISFASSYSSRPPAYSVGETVEVLYAPDDPNDARIDGFGSLWLGPVILGGIGMVFSAIGGGLWIAAGIGERRRNWLMAYGTAVQTDFQGVERNTSLKINGRSPWCIVSQWQNPETSKLLVFKSENLWFDPTRYVGGKQLTVLLDPQNLKRYHMDVSFLPELA